MSLRAINFLLIAALVFVPDFGRGRTLADEAAAKQPRTLRLGGVAYSPDSVTIWSGIRHYFAKNGMPVEYVLYSTYRGKAATKKEVENGVRSGDDRWFLKTLINTKEQTPCLQLHTKVPFLTSTGVRLQEYCVASIA